MKISRYSSGEISEHPPSALQGLLAKKEGALWLDLPGPADEDVRVLRDIFNFHPLAIEDSTKQGQRPKIEEYEGYLFITIHAVRGGSKRSTDVSLDEIDIFFGPGYVVTTHRGGVPALDEARARLVRAPAAQRSGGDYVLYTILDTTVDSYFPVIDALDEALDRLEDRLFAHPSAATLDRLFALKRSLLHMRRVVAPMRDFFNVLTRRDIPLVSPQTLTYFRDVYDHLLRITDLIDTHRDLLTGAMDIYLSVTSNRLNEVVRRLTMITAVFALLAVITGVYGMNFARAYPSFEWRYGFPFTIGVMLVLVGALLTLFRRMRWF
ncbi:MAG: magnesium/cobalt transporter CorA [Armatimonadetes bacterium]|nr:magnesium/cobalt transporter CorA [Armatimonadota bacterium]MBI2247281.1 magnesium/cobalt transporter CorA [Armatimonadota bacterium]MBI2972244.1 magnesium/cobalt transporter CorA [Armatimonadota bacterium]